jgi:hypothetical protein
MNGRRLAPCLRESEAVATPGRDDRAYSLWLVIALICWRDRGLPRTAPSCSAPSARRALCPVFWPLRRVDLCDKEDAVAETAHPSAKVGPRLPSLAGAR